MPCAFLWLFSFLDIFYIKNSINRDIPRSYLNVTKLILTAALIVLSFIDLCVVIAKQSNRDVYPVDYYTPAIKIATFVSSMKFIYTIQMVQDYNIVFISLRHYQLHCCILIGGLVYGLQVYNSYSGFY